MSQLSKRLKTNELAENGYVVISPRAKHKSKASYRNQCHKCLRWVKQLHQIDVGVLVCNWSTCRKDSQDTDTQAERAEMVKLPVAPKREV